MRKAKRIDSLTCGGGVWRRLGCAVAGAMAIAGSTGCGSPDDERNGPYVDDGPPAPQTSCVAADAVAASNGAKLVLGTVEGTTFEPLDQSENLEIQFGGQGGQHVFIAARVLAAQGTTTDLVVTYTADDGANAGMRQASAASCSQGWTAFDNLALVLESSSPSEGILHATATVDGEVIEVEATVEVASMGEFEPPVPPMPAPPGGSDA